MAAPDTASSRWSWCKEHEKRAWVTEADAEASRVRLDDPERIDVYPCEVKAGRFHVGHRPGCRTELTQEAS